MIKINKDYPESDYYFIPRLLIEGDKYIDVSNNSKILYGILLHKYCHLREKEKIYIGNKLYFKISIEEMIKLSGVTRKTVARMCEELEDHSLLQMIKSGRGESAKMHIISCYA